MSRRSALKGLTYPANSFALVLLLQGDESGGGALWWVWFVLISVLLLLLVLSLVRQPGPDVPLQIPEDGIEAQVEAAEVAAEEPKSEPVSNAEETMAMTPETEKTGKRPQEADSLEHGQRDR